MTTMVKAVALSTKIPPNAPEGTMLDQTDAAEQERNFELAKLWMGAHLDKAGSEIFAERATDPSLKRLRSKYGDEAVNERLNQIDQLSPYFTTWLNGDYKLPEEAYQYMPGKATTEAKNVLPIKRVAYGPEKKFLTRFNKGLTPDEAKTAELLYYARRQGAGTEGLVGHEEVPEAFKTLKKLEPLSTRLTNAARQFDKENGTDISKKIGKRWKPTRTHPPYVEEPKHHAGIEEYIKRKTLPGKREGSAAEDPHAVDLGHCSSRAAGTDPELAELAMERYNDLREDRQGIEQAEGGVQARSQLHQEDEKVDSRVLP